MTDVNEAPSVSGGAASIDHAETVPCWIPTLRMTGVEAAVYTATDEDTVDNAADLKWSLSGADASKFDIITTSGATRTLSFKANPDYESPGDSGREQRV